MIIPCEKEYAEQRLKEGFTRQGAFNDLLIVAKYFRYLGKNTPQVEQALIDFCEKFSADYIKIIYEKRIKDAVRKSKDVPLRIFSPIGITRKELESIRSVSDYRAQKVLFTMLVTSKMFKDSRYENSNMCFISLTEILRLARVKLAKQERKDMTRLLNSKNLIDTQGEKKIYRLLFIDKQQEEFDIIVTEKNNIISHLLFKCPSCGKEIPIEAKSRKMCDECWVSHRREWDRKRKEKQ